MSGLPVLNAAYYTSLTQQINGASSCAQLQNLVSEAMLAVINTQSSLTDQLAIYEPMLALLTPPTTPTAVITYIQTLITAYLTPQLAPAITMAAQLAATIAEIAALTAAIESAASKFPSCSITLPTI